MNESSPASSAGAHPDVRGDAVRLDAGLAHFRGRKRRGLAKVDVGADGTDEARPAGDEADVVLGEDPVFFCC